MILATSLGVLQHLGAVGSSELLKDVKVRRVGEFEKMSNVPSERPCLGFEKMTAEYMPSSCGLEMNRNGAEQTGETWRREVFEGKLQLTATATSFAAEPRSGSYVAASDQRQPQAQVVRDVRRKLRPAHKRRSIQHLTHPPSIQMALMFVRVLTTIALCSCRNPVHASERSNLLGGAP